MLVKYCNALLTTNNNTVYLQMQINHAKGMLQHRCISRQSVNQQVCILSRREVVKVVCAREPAENVGHSLPNIV